MLVGPEMQFNSLRHSSGMSCRHSPCAGSRIPRQHAAACTLRHPAVRNSRRSSQHSRVQAQQAGGAAVSLLGVKTAEPIPAPGSSCEQPPPLGPVDVHLTRTLANAVCGDQAVTPCHLRSSTVRVCAARSLSNEAEARHSIIAC